MIPMSYARTALIISSMGSKQNGPRSYSCSWPNWSPRPRTSTEDYRPRSAATSPTIWWMMTRPGRCMQCSSGRYHNKGSHCPTTPESTGPAKHDAPCRTPPRSGQPKSSVTARSPSTAATNSAFRSSAPRDHRTAASSPVTPSTVASAPMSHGCRSRSRSRSWSPKSTGCLTTSC
jgi:hypothetical protein